MQVDAASLVERISSELGRSLRIEGSPLGGFLNDNIIVLDGMEKYLLRIPKKDPPQRQLIDEEYRGIGYGSFGREFRYRTLEEQQVFMARCREAGMDVPNVVHAGAEHLLIEFVNGTQLDNFLKEQDDSAPLRSYPLSVAQAHTRGIVLGDRWGPNTIITPDGKFVEVDFDIELTAEDGREFEIAQVLYYLLLYAKNKGGVINLEKEFIQGDAFSGIYDRNRVADLLEGHVGFFGNHAEYGGISDQVKALLPFLRPQAKSTSSGTLQEKIMVYRFKDRRYRVFLHPEVAKPNYYTDFLAENIMPVKGGTALDIGIGCGVHAILLIDHYQFGMVDGIDINPDSVRLAQRNILDRRLGNRVTVLAGEFPKDFSKEPESYDLIITDPPQIPTPPGRGISHDGFYFTNEGGPDGRRVVDSILSAIGQYLKDKGRFQILHADFIGIEKTQDLLRAAGLEPEITARRKTRPGRLTSSRVDYIESLGYKFQRDKDGPFFDLVVISGKK